MPKITNFVKRIKTNQEKNIYIFFHMGLGAMDGEGGDCWAEIGVEKSEKLAVWVVHVWKFVVLEKLTFVNFGCELVAFKLC